MPVRVGFRVRGLGLKFPLGVRQGSSAGLSKMFGKGLLRGLGKVATLLVEG